MLLLGALFALFISGFWVYCLVDVALTPSSEFRRLPKSAWIAFVVVTFVIGAVVWLAVRGPAQPTAAPGPPGPSGTGNLDGGHPGNERPRPADEAGARTASRPSPGPEGGILPRGPDDDPEFLRSLDQAIHGDGPAVA
jgi:Phospholipase_D-nuclease N-terminal